jgi:hypothetical protein
MGYTSGCDRTPMTFPSPFRSRITRVVGRPHACDDAWPSCSRSLSVLFDTASNWIACLAAAQHSGQLETELKKIRRYKLITIDAANLFFQLIASRYEHGSVMVTSNLPFDRCGKTFSDDVVAAAMIDRLVYHAEVLTLTGDSYRSRQRRERLSKDNGTGSPVSHSDHQQYKRQPSA